MRPDTHTANLHLAPQLRLGLVALAGLAWLLETLSQSCITTTTATAVRRHDLTGMDEAVGLQVGAARVVCDRRVGHALRVCDTGRRRARNLAGANTPRQALRLLPLQLLKHPFDGNGLEYILRRSGQDSQDGEGAVLLVLLEPAAKTTA